MQRTLNFLLFIACLLSISFVFSRYFANAQIPDQTSDQTLGQPSVQVENSRELGNDDHNKYADPLHSYTVREGDTLLSIALEINVDLNDMYCILAPGFQRTQPLIIGEKLPLPLPGSACHLTTVDDSMATIAEAYNVLVSELVNMAWNRAAYSGLTTLSSDS